MFSCVWFVILFKFLLFFYSVIDFFFIFFIGVCGFFSHLHLHDVYAGTARVEEREREWVIFFFTVCGPFAIYTQTHESKKKCNVQMYR